MPKRSRRDSSPSRSDNTPHKGIPRGAVQAETRAQRDSWWRTVAGWVLGLAVAPFAAAVAIPIVVLLTFALTISIIVVRNAVVPPSVSDTIRQQSSIPPPPRWPGSDALITPRNGSRPTSLLIRHAREIRVITYANAAELPRGVTTSAVLLPLASGNVSADLARHDGYVMTGDIDLRVGPLLGRDGLDSYIQQGIDTDGHAKSVVTFDFQIHGPPRNERRPYIDSVTLHVVGQVVTFHGPEQFDNSRLGVHVVDLGPAATEVATYERRLFEWQRRVAERTSLTWSELRDIYTKEAAEKLLENKGAASPTHGNGTERPGKELKGRSGAKNERPPRRETR